MITEEMTVLILEQLPATVRIYPISCETVDVFEPGLVNLLGKST